MLTELLGTMSAGVTPRQSRSPLLNLTEPIRTVHLLPGRVRFRIPALVGNLRGRDTIITKLPDIEGIHSVDVNAISGSVLIEHDEAAIAPELLFAVLIRLLGLEKELEKPPKSVISQELRNIGDSMNRAVYHKSHGIVDMWTLLYIVLAVIGARMWMSNPSGAFPGGFTLLWWASGWLLRGQE